MPGHRARMKAKLRTRGGEALSDHELLEMILFMNFRRGDVKPLVKELLNTFGSLGKILNASEAEITSVKGAGPAAFELFTAMRAFYHRLGQQEIQESDILSNWEAVLNFAKNRIGYKKIEKFMVIYLNSQNHVITDEILSSGTINKTAIFPREIVKNALRHQEAAIIILHNHPTGNLRPSQADIDLTRQIKAALQTVDISLHDHLIVRNDDTVSFKAMGLLS